MFTEIGFDRPAVSMLCTQRVAEVSAAHLSRVCEAKKDELTHEWTAKMSNVTH